MIAGFYVFGAIVLLIIAVLNSYQPISIADRFGMPGMPERLMRLLVAAGSIIMAYGYFMMKKWGYWFMMIYSVYFLGVSITLAQIHKQQPFYGNIVWSVIVIVYTLYIRKAFSGRQLAIN